MAKRFVPTLCLLSLFGAVPVVADPLSNGIEIELAFADMVGPRGITLSNGDEDEGVVEKPTRNVTFDESFSDVDDAIDGKSIRELIGGSPLFPPIEGLPEALWKDKECSSCHAWTKETLCEQGGFYNKQGLGAVERKEHPYGGSFKREVMRWADQGCK